MIVAVTTERQGHNLGHRVHDLCCYGLSFHSCPLCPFGFRLCLHRVLGRHSLGLNRCGPASGSSPWTDLCCRVCDLCFYGSGLGGGDQPLRRHGPDRFLS